MQLLEGVAVALLIVAAFVGGFVVTNRLMK